MSIAELVNQRESLLHELSNSDRLKEQYTQLQNEIVSLSLQRQKLSEEISSISSRPALSQDEIQHIKDELNSTYQSIDQIKFDIAEIKRKGCEYLHNIMETANLDNDT